MLSVLLLLGTLAAETPPAGAATAGPVKHEPPIFFALRFEGPTGPVTLTGTDLNALLARRANLGKAPAQESDAAVTCPIGTIRTDPAVDASAIRRAEPIDRKAVRDDLASCARSLR